MKHIHELLDTLLDEHTKTILHCSPASVLLAESPQTKLPASPNRPHINRFFWPYRFLVASELVQSAIEIIYLLLTQDLTETTLNGKLRVDVRMLGVASVDLLIKKYMQ